MEFADHRRAKQIFERALDLEGPERHRVVRKACDGDSALRREVEELLTGVDDDSEFMRRSPLWGRAELAACESMGPYQIEREIGRGGQAVVYVASDTRLPRRVALKVLHGLGPGAEDALMRFRREAAAASRLDHPGICTVYEAGREEGAAYIAMQLVEGETLAVRIASRRKLESRGAPDVDAALLLFEQLADALHAAHEAGIVHRDVKPGNIVITPAGQPVILDFGLARDTDSDTRLTSSGRVFGTPSYMSPEQVNPDGEPVDARSDVFSLGVSLYEFLTGVRPFQGATRDAVHRAIIDDTPTDPRRHRALPKDLKAVLDVALCKERDRRYETSAAFRDDLRRVREKQPIRARPPGVATRVHRWARRNPAVALSASVVFVTLAAGLALAVWGNRQLARQAAFARSQTAESSFLAATLAAERGDWNEAILLYDRAHEYGHPRPIDATLGKVVALCGALRNEEARRVLDSLEYVPPDQRGRVLLLRGCLVNRIDDPLGGLDQVQAAIELGLGPADEAFARAQLATNFEECVSFLRFALERDPTHRLANETLTGVSVFVAPLDEAEPCFSAYRARYPDDAHIPYFDIYLTARRDGVQAALRRIDDWSDHVTEEEARVMRLAARHLQALWDPDVFDRRFTSPRIIGLTDLARFVADVATGMWIDDEESIGLPDRIFAPPIFSRYFEAWVGFAAGPDARWPVPLLMSLPARRLGITGIPLEDALERFPSDPAFLVVRAGQHMAAAEWELARAHYLAAANGGYGIVRSFGRISLLQAAGCDFAMVLEGTPDEARRALGRGRSTLEPLVTRERLNLEQWCLLVRYTTLLVHPDLYQLHAAHGALWFGDIPDVLLAELVSNCLNDPHAEETSLARARRYDEEHPGSGVESQLEGMLAEIRAARGWHSREREQENGTRSVPCEEDH